MVDFINKFFSKQNEKKDVSNKSDKTNIELTKIYHSCFLIKFSDNTTILTDPYFNNKSVPNLKLLEQNNYDIKKLPKVNIILISHEHFDHFDKEAIDFLVNRDKSIVVGPYEVTKNLNIEKNLIRTIKVDDKIIVSNTNIEVVCAQHPQSFYPVGYIIKKDNKTIYFAGDTNSLPKIIEDIDIAILPAGGILTSDMFEFISMTRQLKCKLAIPMHYNTFEIIKINIEKFKSRCEEKLKNCKVEILDNNKNIKI